MKTTKKVKSQKKCISVSTYLEKDLLDKLNKYCEDTRFRRSWVLNMAAREYLENRVDNGQTTNV